jgi:hypothetical protein
MRRLLGIAGIWAFSLFGFRGTAAGPSTPQLIVPTPEAQGKVWTEEKATLQRLGSRYPSASDLYQAFKTAAHGGRRLSYAKLPDWSGVYWRGDGQHQSFRFDPDLDDGAEDTQYSEKLTPAAQEHYQKLLMNLKAGIEYDDALSSCLPAGVPRWFTEPSLRDFVVTPDETYMSNQIYNETRRIYTDGRSHPNADDGYPSYDGDSIGFWDGDKLVVHTQQLKAGRYQRREPEYSDAVQVVEVWRKVNATTLVAFVWTYDSATLQEPWFTRQYYTKDPNSDKAFRIDYYDCVGAPNTRVIKTKEGSSTFEDLNFDKKPNAHQ